MRPRLSRPQSAPLSRRSFLKLTAVFGAASGAILSLPDQPEQLSLCSALPLPIPYHHVSDPDALLVRSDAAFDLLLVPAYIAGELIRRHALLKLAGPPGRAHDPEGAFTIPYAYAVGALVHRRGRPPQMKGGAWQADALWPDWPRLVVGAALQWRGYSPNEPHAGRLEQARQSFGGWRPHLAANPLSALEMGLTDLAYVPVPLTEAGEPQLPQAADWMLPPEGSVLVEYDWVIPAATLEPNAARRLIAQLTPQRVSPPITAPVKLVPLASLPAAARAQHASLWAKLTST